MLESQQSRSNLDQDWVRGMGIVSEGVPEWQQSQSNLNQKLGGEYWHTTSKSARITTPSVKSGSRLAERYGDSSSMPESQQCRSNLDQNWLRGMRIVSEGMLESQQSVKSGSRLVGMYWHTTSRYSRITTPSVKSGSRLAESYGDQKIC